MRRERGLSMVELLISTAVITTIMAGVLMLSLHGQRTHMTESHRDDMFQNLRFVKQLLTEKIRSAGAGIGQTNLPNINDKILNSYFLGIYPLNNANFPDGIILAAAEPDAYGKVPQLTSYSPGTAILPIETLEYRTIRGIQESVQTRDDPMQTEPEWKTGDIGIIMNNEGYYVFKVDQDPAIGAYELVVRQEPVYYSGLLNTDHYRDNLHLLTGGQTGDLIEYTSGCPIWKLNYFHIYLVVEDLITGEKTLTLTTDTRGAADPLDPVNASMETGIPIAGNLIDLQFEYVTQNEINMGQYEYWCSHASIDFYGETINSYPTPCSEDPTNVDAQCQLFYDLFMTASLRSIIVNIAVRTDELTFRRGKPKAYLKPIMGDSGDQSYNTRHYYRDVHFEVLLRNFRYQGLYNR